MDNLKIIEKCAKEIYSQQKEVQRKSIDDYSNGLSEVEKNYDEKILETVALSIIKQSLGISGHSNIENLLKDYIFDKSKREKIDKIITQK